MDCLLVQPIGRGRWLAGRLAAGAGLVIAGSAVTGVACWIGAASQNSGVGFGQLLSAGSTWHRRRYWW